MTSKNHIFAKTSVMSHIETIAQKESGWEKPMLTVIEITANTLGDPTTGDDGLGDGLAS